MSSLVDEQIRGISDGRCAFAGPEQVVIDITNRCNNNCIGCWTRSPLLRDVAPGASWESLELPMEIASNLISDLASMGTERIRFTGGGEPFMHQGLRELISQTKSLGMKCAVTTNFTLIGPEDVDLIASLPVDELAVSLWAASPHTYSRLHPNKTERTFLRIRDTLDALTRRRDALPRITICNVMCAMNYGEFDAMIRFAQDLHVDAVYFTLIDPVPERTDGLLLQPPQQEHLLNSIRQLEESGGLGEPGFPVMENWENFVSRLKMNDPVEGNYDRSHIDEIPCYVGWIFCRIMADGGVSPCCRGVQRPMGNLHEKSFKEIWFSEVYNHFREVALNNSKTDTYFHPIGCTRTCDNLMHNQEMHQRLDRATQEHNIRQIGGDS